MCRALPLLLSQLGNVSAEPEAAACAASALWALMHRGERVKATLKGLPGALASVQRCLIVTSSLLQHERHSAVFSAEAHARVDSLQRARDGVAVVARLLGARAY